MVFSLFRQGGQNELKLSIEQWQRQITSMIHILLGRNRSNVLRTSEKKEKDRKQTNDFHGNKNGAQFHCPNANDVKSFLFESLTLFDLNSSSIGPGHLLLTCRADEPNDASLCWWRLHA